MEPNGSLPNGKELNKKSGLHKKTVSGDSRIFDEKSEKIAEANAASRLLNSEEKPDDSVLDKDGGVMLTTSEIIDFAQGTDSWT